MSEFDSYESLFLATNNRRGKKYVVTLMVEVSDS
jgi:hypothetical protein